MTARAFIIAIEKYDTLPTLDGVNVDANSFYSWLVDKKGLRPDSIFGCADKTVCPWATTGTTVGEIVNELFNLWRKVTQMADTGDATTEFYFFYSGHGLANTKTSNDKPVDHLVASDFTDPMRGGRQCLEFYQIKENLYRSLGPVTHYYFIDACRNTNYDVKPAGTGFNPPVAANGSTGATFWLFSTAQKEVAARDSGFAQALVDGLNGEGEAKDWYKNKLWVIFTNLYEYVDKQIRGPQQVDSDQEGKGRGLILEVKPIPKYFCEIKVENADPEDEFTLMVSHGGKNEEYKFKGDSYKFSVAPKYYDIALSHPTAEVVQKAPPPSDDGISLFNNQVMRFEKKEQMRATDPLKESIARAMGLPVEVTFTAALFNEIQLEDLSSDWQQSSFGTLQSAVKPGDYLLRLRQKGVTLGKKKLTIKPGKPLNMDLHEPSLNLSNLPPSAVQNQFVKVIAGLEDPQLAHTFQSFSPSTTLGLNLLLSLIGASRIVSSANEYPKLNQLPLAGFDKMRKNDSPVYLLAGFEKSKGVFGVGLSDGEMVDWQEMSKVKTFTGIYEKLIPATPGSHLLSVKIPKQAPVTYATHCLPNRATLVVLTEDTGGRLTLHQYILPIRVLFGYLESEVLNYLRSDPLEVVWLMFMAQTQFNKKRPVFGEKGRSDRNAKMLLGGKWLDPIMSLIGAYELIRQGKLKDNPNRLNLMLSNLRKYFAGLPDTEAIAKIAGQQWKMPEGAPLLLDSILAFDELQERRILTLPYDQVDYGSPWTSWRGMVNDFERKRKSRSRGAEIRFWPWDMRQATPILMVSANPLDTSRLSLEVEAHEIAQGLRQSALRDKFVIELKRVTSVGNLRRALLTVNPRIVHFSGHGTVDGLVFENQKHQKQIVSPETLANLFELFAGKVECVLLNACYSVPQAEAISKHIDYVIGVPTEISDRAAIEFAVGFYDALGAGWPIKEAYRLGCNALRMEGVPRRLEPVLHVKSKRRTSRVQKPPAQD